MANQRFLGLRWLTATVALVGLTACASGGMAPSAVLEFQASTVPDFWPCGGDRSNWRWLGASSGLDNDRGGPGLWPGFSCRAGSFCIGDESGLWICKPSGAEAGGTVYGQDSKGESRRNSTTSSTLAASRPASGPANDTSHGGSSNEGGVLAGGFGAWPAAGTWAHGRPAPRVPRSLQCGGAGGMCGVGGLRQPCIDGPWPGVACAEGLECVARDASWWECGEPRTQQPLPPAVAAAVAAAAAAVAADGSGAAGSVWVAGGARGKATAAAASGRWVKAVREEDEEEGEEEEGEEGEGDGWAAEEEVRRAVAAAVQAASVVLPAGGQCGGRGGGCGEGGSGNCVDEPWEGYRCPEGLSCSRESVYRWACMEAPEPPPGELPFAAQCGGEGGRCGLPGRPSCQDAPWPAFPCRPGLDCVRESARSWTCGLPPDQPDPAAAAATSGSGSASMSGDPPLHPALLTEALRVQAGLAAAAVAAAASSSWATKGHSLDPAAGVIDSGGSGGGGGGGREGAAAVVRAAADARSGAQQHHVHAGSSRPLGRAGGRAAAGVGVDCAEGTSDLQHRQQQQQQRAAASRGADGSDGGSGSSAAATGGVGGPVAAAAAPRSKLCWAVSYWRGFGAEPNICPPERPLFSHGRCYPGCPAGYGAREGPLCWMRHCPQSWRDDGPSCFLPAHSYARGSCCQASAAGSCAACCEPCLPGYAQASPEDPCTCSRVAQTFAKACCYDPGVPARCTTSRSDMEGGLCYSPCRPGHVGLLDRCWLGRPSDWMRAHNLTQQCGIMAFARVAVPPAAVAAEQPSQRLHAHTLSRSSAAWGGAAASASPLPGSGGGGGARRALLTHTSSASLPPVTSAASGTSLRGPGSILAAGGGGNDSGSKVAAAASEAERERQQREAAAAADKCEWFMRRWARVARGIGTAAASCLVGHLVTGGPLGMVRAAAGAGSICGLPAVAAALPMAELVELAGSGAIEPCQHD